MKYAAVIQTRRENENIDAALSSLLPLKKQIHWIIVESPFGKHSATENGIIVTDNYESAIPIGCEALVFLNPECSVTETGMKKLFTAVKQNQGYTHYSMSSVLYPAETSAFSLLLIIMCAIDWCWSRFDRGKHPLDYHVRVTLIVTVGNRRFPANRPWYWRFWNGGEFPLIDGQSNAIVKTTQSGLEFFVDAIKRHPYQFSVWSPFGSIWLISWYFGFAFVVLGMLYKLDWLLSFSLVALVGLFFSIALRKTLALNGLPLLCLFWPLYFVIYVPLGIVIKIFV
jgi:hypothetical protein